jgi:NADH:ubiquinone oxidoreductase subunit 6 (subunit J)
MNYEVIIAYFFYAITAISSICILFSRNVFSSAVLLLITLLGIAALYVMSFAEFVAVTQILIYAGGVVVVIIFGIMLTTKLSGVALKVGNSHILSASILSVLLFAGLAAIFTRAFGNLKVNSVSTTDSVSGTGIQLMTSYVLPFEVAGILLLIALLGATVISSASKKSA